MMDEFEIWIKKARCGDLDEAAVARLAERLADSGERLDVGERTADLASTGGPGSLSTLWGPAALVASGFLVPKLGVPGRPAGGIDVLAQLPGYAVDLDVRAAREVLDRCGYVHILAGKSFAPADAEMFAHRQRVGAQAIPALAIASLLAKKLAVGVQCVGLEVRVAAHGNFGGRETAAANAHMFLRTARLLSMQATCFVTDGSIPQQPYLGRSEALLALFHLMAGTAALWLQDHATTCEEWAATLAHSGPPVLSAVRGAFRANVAAQGGSMDALEEKAQSTVVAHTRIVVAERDGVVFYDLGRLRQAILEARPADHGHLFDDSVGLILLAQPGAAVRTGEPLISARCRARTWPALRDAVAAATRLADPEDLATSSPVFGTLEVIGVGGR